MLLVPEGAALRGPMRWIVAALGAALVVAGVAFALMSRDGGAPWLVGGFVLLVGGLHFAASALRGRWPQTDPIG